MEVFGGVWKRLELRRGEVGSGWRSRSVASYVQDANLSLTVHELPRNSCRDGFIESRFERPTPYHNIEVIPETFFEAMTSIAVMLSLTLVLGCP